MFDSRYNTLYFKPKYPSYVYRSIINILNSLDEKFYRSRNYTEKIETGNQIGSHLICRVCNIAFNFLGASKQEKLSTTRRSNLPIHQRYLYSHGRIIVTNISRPFALCLLGRTTNFHRTI